MAKDNVIDLKKPVPFVDDPITDVLRTGAGKLLAEALGPRQKINTPSGLSFGPSAALHPPAHIH